ncbi:MAG: thermopsin [Thermocladium sp.]
MMRYLVLVAILVVASSICINASQIVLKPYSALPINISDYWSNYSLWFHVSSNSSIDIYVLNQTQYSEQISDWPAPRYEGLNISGLVSIGEGNWYLILRNPSNTSAMIDYSYGTIPINPFLSYPEPPAPIGLADYGVINESGLLVPYSVLTNEAVGIASIYYINVSSSEPINSAPPHAVSLQLNVVLQVNSTRGRYAYWLQNVVAMDTSSMTYDVIDNVWNMSSPNATLSNSSIRGSGSVAASPSGYFYWYSYTNQSYSLPLNIKLATWIQTLDSGIIIHFAYYDGGKEINYDNVTIPIQDPRAAIMINGYHMVGEGPSYYDAEFVLGGDANGSEAIINGINASLHLYYLINDSYALPRGIYIFGSNTAETVSGVNAIYDEGGVRLSHGVPRLGVPFIVELTIIKQHMPSMVVDEGVNTSINATIYVGGGEPPYTYYLVLDGATRDSYTTDGVFHDFEIYVGNLSLGVHQYQVVVRDSRGAEVYSEVGDIEVMRDPSLNAALNASILDAGQWIKITAAGANGTPPYSYEVLDNGSPVTGLIYGELSQAIRMNGAGIHIITIIMRDSGGSTVNKSFTVLVNPDPLLHLSINATSMDAGQTVLANLSTSGGTPPYSYEVLLNSTRLNCTTMCSLRLGVGRYVLSATVRDSSGYSYSKAVMISVNPDPSILISLNATTIDDGEGISLVLNGINGTPPYSYEALLDGSVINATQLIRPGIGTHDLTVVLRDASNYTVDRSITIRVNPDPVINVSLIPISNFVLDDYEARGVIIINNGTPPYSIKWFLNGVEVASGSEVTINLTRMGVNNVTIMVLDSTGRGARYDFSINYGYDVPRVITLIAIGILIIALSIILRSRSRKL